ncbi:3'-5'-exoribonuclease [Balamuthia mandrillaris]
MSGVASGGVGAASVSGGGTSGGSLVSRAKELSTNERDFILASLLESRRVDGRGLFDFRALRLTFGHEPGHCQLQLGQTRIYVVVSCQVVEPYADRPTEGFFHFNTEFSPMADPLFEGGRPSEGAIELGRIVERGLRESRAIDTEALCIKAGESVWAIRCDIHVLDNGGNLIDSASIATMAALLHFRRPDVTIDGDNVIVHPFSEREPVPLSIHHVPICVTFGFFQQGQYLVVDPSWKEEQVMEGRMTVILNTHKEICGVQKGGGTPLDLDTILRCNNIAAVKVAELSSAIERAMATAATGKLATSTEPTAPLQYIAAHEYTPIPLPQEQQQEESLPCVAEELMLCEGHQTNQRRKNLQEEEEEEDEDEEEGTSKLHTSHFSIGEGGQSQWESPRHEHSLDDVASSDSEEESVEVLVLGEKRADGR